MLSWEPELRRSPKQSCVQCHPSNAVVQIGEVGDEADSSAVPIRGAVRHVLCNSSRLPRIERAHGVRCRTLCTQAGHFHNFGLESFHSKSVRHTWAEVPAFVVRAEDKLDVTRRHRFTSLLCLLPPDVVGPPVVDVEKGDNSCTKKDYSMHDVTVTSFDAEAWSCQNFFSRGPVSVSIRDSIGFGICEELVSLLCCVRMWEDTYQL